MSCLRGTWRRATVASLALAALAPACSGGETSGGAEVAARPVPPEDAGAPEVGDADAAIASCVLSREAEAHACLHAKEGPFADLASGQTATDAHVVFEVPVVDGAFEVGFRPPRSGAWAFFVSPAGTALDVRLRGISTTPRRLEDPSCRALGAAHVVPLTSDVTVWLVGTTTVARARLLAERVDELDLVGGACPRDLSLPDGGLPEVRNDGGAPGNDAGICRSTGPCTRDDECCEYCHDMDHCH